MGISSLQANTVTTAQPTVVDRVISPTMYFTDGYLNDPIQIVPDSRFDPQSIVTQLNILPNQIERDFASFLQVDSNNENAQQLAVNMFSPVWDPVNYGKVMTARKTFTFFV